jgi:hypothetical protein
MDPDQTARMQPAHPRSLVWIHAGHKPIMLVLPWHGSNYALPEDQTSYHWITNLMLSLLS